MLLQFQAKLLILVSIAIEEVHSILRLVVLVVHALQSADNENEKEHPPFTNKRKGLASSSEHLASLPHHRASTARSIQQQMQESNPGQNRKRGVNPRQPSCS